MHDEKREDLPELGRNNDKKQIEKSFVTQAAIISVSNFVVKIIGVVYKIPLSRILNDSMGIFNAAYSIYAMLFMISTAGLPVAVSKLVAASNERGRQREADKVYRVCLIIFGLIGLICTAFMILFAENIAVWSKHNDSVAAMRVIAPTLFFVCISSAIRGYFHGYRRMVPTAVSQFIEAFFKLALGLGGALFARHQGYSTAIQAAYAISGLTVGTFLGTVYLIVCKRLSKKKNRLELSNDSESYGSLMKKIAYIALPVTITSSALYLNQFLDTLVINRSLTGSGLSKQVSEQLYTSYTTLAVSISDLLPSTLVYPIAISILPAVSGAYSVKDNAKAEQYIYSSVRISGIIALPCCFCLATLSRPCISLIYGSDWGSSITMYNGSVVRPIDVASIGLSILALNIFFTSIVSTTSALLQACGKSMLPLISVLSGVSLLVVLEIFLTSIPAVGIYGAPLSTIGCYIVTFSLNMLFLIKKQKISLSMSRLFLKPLICAAVSGCAAFGIYRLCALALNVDTRLGSLGILLISSIAAVAVYASFMLLLKGISDSEVRLLPFGNRIADLLERMKLLKKGE